MREPADYQGREQALVKHYVLEHYLEQLAFKIAQFKPGTTLNYIDAFSGPWDAKQSDFSDSSPWIALDKLRRVRDQLKQRPKPVPLTVRALFIEKDPEALGRLQRVREQFLDVPTEVLPGEFAGHVSEALKFARSGGQPFAFTFIDPTGWTGLPLAAITPLLQVSPGEVLINFMLGHIVRFIDSEDAGTRESFDDLFGQASAEYLLRWKTLRGLDREDAIVSAYCERVRMAGGFTCVGSTAVLNPKADRTHYHLIYGTRSLRGLATFRDVERTATPMQEQSRVEAKRRGMEARSGQSEMFPEMLDTGYATELRERYESLARRDIERLLTPGKVVLYDDVVLRALRFPFVSEQTVKSWLGSRADRRDLEVMNLSPGRRVPQLGKGNCIRRRESSMQASDDGEEGRA